VSELEVYDDMVKSFVSAGTLHSSVADGKGESRAGVPELAALKGLRLQAIQDKASVAHAFEACPFQRSIPRVFERACPLSLPIPCLL
jgi:hypothetical protein